MIWKILFVLFVLILSVLMYGGMISEENFSEFALSIGYMFFIGVVFVAGYFYSLGWNKRLYSKKANNIIFSLITLYMILSMVYSVIGGMPEVVLSYKQQAPDLAESSIYTTALILLGLISFVLYSVIYSPVLVAYFSYRKRCETMEEVKKPYWKLFLMGVLWSSVIGILYAVVNYDSAFNGWDIFAIGSVVLDVLLYIGYAFDKKFGPQILWKVVLVPYAVLNIASLFFCSETFLEITHGNLLFSSYAVMVVTSICNAAILYVMYRYAFTDDVYKNEPQLTAENSENNENQEN